MAKAKPKKAKAKPKAKPKSKPKPKKPKARAKPASMAAPPPAPPPAPSYGKPLIVKGIDPSGAGIETGFALETKSTFPSDCAPTDVSDPASSAVFTIVGFSFGGMNNTIMRIGIASNSTTTGCGDSGSLQITLFDPPGDLPIPVPLPVDYIDDLP
jgi:hypothetical protein